MELSTTTEKDVDVMTATQHTPRSATAGQRTAPVLTTPAAVEPTTGFTPRQATRYVLAGLRIALGWVFLWAFLDKLFGLGHATPSAGAWINGGSPTKGFLGKAVAGPFADMYHNIAGATWADSLFMVGLLAIGVALILGIGLRFAAVAGGVLLVLMWSAVLPPASNPFMDDHLVYAGVLALLALTAAGDTLGLGRMWARLPIVERMPWLR
jgi:thiosulfate dehydrogenase [quinone] large subunit